MSAQKSSSRKAHTQLTSRHSVSEQRTRYHQQLADWYRRRCLVRMEEADVKPNDIVTHLDTISDQLARCGDAIGSATLMCAAAKLYGEVHMPRHVRNDGVFIGRDCFDLTREQGARGRECLAATAAN